MNSSIRNKFKSHLTGFQFFRLLLELRRKFIQSRYKRQNRKIINVHGARMVAPASHPIEELTNHSPLRDLNVGLMAKEIAVKHPDSIMVDIGANIGDTAFLMSTQCRNDLILIEASEYFVTFLKENLSQIDNKCELHHTMLGDGSETTGVLHHWGGTSFLDKACSENTTQTVKLSDIVGKRKVCFIKSDTDGNDFNILISSMDVIEQSRPAFLYEHQLMSRRDCVNSQKLIEALIPLGYKHLMIWDTEGRHAYSSSNLKDLASLCDHAIESTDESKPINDFDVAIFHESDQQVFISMCKHYADRDKTNPTFSQQLLHLVDK